MHVNRTGSNHHSDTSAYGDSSRPAAHDGGFRSFVNACPSPAFVVAPDGMLSFCNDAFRRLAGVPADASTGIRIESLFDEETGKRILALHGNSGDFRGTCQNQAEGSRFHVTIRVCQVQPEETVVFLTPGGPAPSSFSTARPDERLVALGMATTGISHHLNSLLSGILGNLNVAALDAPPAILPALKIAERATDRAATFTGKLMDLARGAHTTPSVIDPEPLIDETIELFRSLTDPRVAVDVVKHSPLCPIQADAASLHLALLTLCMNAWNAVSEACHTSRELRTHRIVIEAGPATPRMENGEDSGEAPRLAISVSDSGTGISGEVRRRLFEPFFTTRENRGGAGIGLASARNLIEEQGGRIEVSTCAEKGSKFTVLLPAAPSGEHTMTERISRDLPCGTETILFMDDDELVRGFGRAILERQGYTVLLASDGDTGLELFLRERESINLVIIDMIMPTLSGDEVLRKIRRSGPAPRVILTTGFDRQSACDQTADLGELPILLKPFTIRSLTETVRTALDDGGFCAE